MEKFIAPKYKETKFTCPHCGAISYHGWNVIAASERVYKRVGGIGTPVRGAYQPIIEYEKEWERSLCDNCLKPIIWRDGRIIYPNNYGAEMPNEDLPEDIKNDYLEAASILNRSPRGSAALLRLCVQKLCIHLGKKGKNLNDDIGELVKEGLPEKVSKAMDSLRVIGNSAVHPGELDITDDIETATKLFSLVNFIAEKMITEPKEIDSFYNKTVPESAKGAINKRDKK